MNNETKHTTTPYNVCTTKDEIAVISNDGQIATVYHSEVADNGLDNVAFIVRACNEHAALLAVAEAASEAIEDGKLDGVILINLKNAIANLAAIRNQKA